MSKVGMFKLLGATLTEWLIRPTGSLSGFPRSEASRGIPTPSGWDAGPSQGYPAESSLPVLKVSCPRTQRSTPTGAGKKGGNTPKKLGAHTYIAHIREYSPPGGRGGGFEPEPLETESSALTIRPAILLFHFSLNQIQPESVQITKILTLSLHWNTALEQGLYCKNSLLQELFWLVTQHFLS